MSEIFDVELTYKITGSPTDSRVTFHIELEDFYANTPHGEHAYTAESIDAAVKLAADLDHIKITREGDSFYYVQSDFNADTALVGPHVFNSIDDAAQEAVCLAIYQATGVWFNDDHRHALNH